MELVEIRWNVGQLEYRSRLTEEFFVLGHESYGEGDDIDIVSRKWGPWRKVEGVKGDASDAERWPG